MNNEFGYNPKVLCSKHTKAFIDIIKKNNFYIILSKYVVICNGPGIHYSLSVGYMVATAIHQIYNKQIHYVDHIESHILSVFIEHRNKIKFPYIFCLITGGHCLIGIAYSLGKYVVLTKTIDDAPGEVLDKIARKINLPIHDGKCIEQYAKKHNQLIESLINFKTYIKNNKNNEFISFSGIKTRFIYYIKKLSIQELNNQIYNVCASVQYSVFTIIINSLKKTVNRYIDIKNIAIVGGVASNYVLKSMIETTFKYNNIFTTSPKYSCDNAEMVANTFILNQCCESINSIKHKIYTTNIIN
ncbi:tRNA N6-adenosine threonylcarbamoyltransferase [bacterium AB1]|nr:tRNA N6-adenosine threonylcarbamoyltransferase [bacterium AB1]